MSLPKEGLHVATITGRSIVAEYDSGAIGFEFPVSIDDDDVAWRGTARVIIVLKDNSVSENGIKSLKQTFGINGSLESICDLCEKDLPVTQVEFAQCKHEEYEGKPQFKLGFLNPVGGASRMSEPADRKAILAKYGSRFRALSGGATANPAAAKSEPKKASIPAQPVKKGPPSAPTRTIQAPTATQDEAWEACMKAGIATDANPEPWFAAIDATFGDGSREKSETFSIQQWGQLKQKFEQG